MAENENIALLNVSESETTINELDPKGSVSASDNFATSDTNNDDYKVTAQQISDFCAENEIIGERITEALVPYDTAKDAAPKVERAINAALTNYDNKSEVDAKISAAIGDFATGTTNTAADAQKKVVTIRDYTPKNNDVVGIIFTNGNAYGETTASTPTHPTLQINDGVIYDICDSRGHFAGKGFCDAGDYIEFRLVGNKAIILNSDIRESVKSDSSGYTIKSNGLIRQSFTKTLTPSILGGGPWYHAYIEKQANQKLVSCMLKNSWNTPASYWLQDNNTIRIAQYNASSIFTVIYELEWYL